MKISLVSMCVRARTFVYMTSRKSRTQVASTKDEPPSREAKRRPAAPPPPRHATRKGVI